MRDINRIDEFLEKFKKIWKANPDLRFMQLIFNVFDSPFAYYVEDDEAIQVFEEIYKS